MTASSTVELGRHVLRVLGDSGPALLHTITGALLPGDAPEDLLQHGLFLQGQEEEAIHSALQIPETTLSLTLINTWACNLRCTHCSVLDRLEEEVTQPPDPGRLAGFVTRYLEERPQTTAIHAHLLGGEPLLDLPGARSLLDVLEGTGVSLRASVTTNGAIEWSPEVLAVLQRLDRINVSLDGDRISHDRQRRFLHTDASPHRAAMGFLTHVLESGLGDRLHVQAAVTDRHANAAVRGQWYRDLIAIGVPVGQVQFQSVHPTARIPRGGTAWRAGLGSTTIRTRACCRHRASTHWVVEPNGDLRPDFYNGPLLGTLDSDPSELFDAHAQYRRENMPALQDPNCRACPVLGLCWGGCVQGESVVGSRPSDHCDQAALVERAHALAAEGALTLLRGRAGCGDESA